MGLGIAFLFVFILAPITVILSIAWLISKKLLFGKILGFIWLGLFALMIFAELANKLSSKTLLEKEDYYGEYIINRDYFKGPQTDWQYNHFRFKITDKDSIYFYVTEKERILETYRGKIGTITHYSSARLLIGMEQPSHHILTSYPTTYRSAWSFYLVFDSPNFQNVFFKKGKWKSIE